MIQRIEVWNFESHEHSVLEDLSPGLNLLLGDSNSGKTSISARALKLVAYNDFNPRSVRTGATHCVVQVDTDKGRVKVTRGPKHNAWEVTKTGQQTQYFDKVGVNIIPEVSEIIGLNIVTLGDVKVPVNIMDQLESHFMLAGVGDKDATGSMRAQIVDEISGLSGIESIIKDVSLDNTRFGREIKEIEKQMAVVRGQLHPEPPLKEEEEVLTKAEQELKDSAMMLSLMDEGNDLMNKVNSASRQISDLNRRESEIPNTALAIQEISRAEELTVRAVSAGNLHRDGVISAGRLAGINKILAGMPDVQQAACFLNESDTASRVLVNATDIYGRWKSASRDVVVKQDMDRKIVEALKSSVEMGKAQDAVTKRGEAETLLWEAQQKMASLAGLQDRIKDYERLLKDAEKERDDLLALIKTCPLTLKPVFKQCMEGVIV
jgi:predicted  nucleic acid-binding Zn-ribbon protein